MEKNLHNTEAIQKLQALASEIKTCMLVTSGKSGKHAIRPMAVIDTDDHGNLWFFADVHSNKIMDLEADQQVQLIFAHPGKELYMDIHGRANIIDDKQYIKDKWSPLVQAWFPGGSENSALCLIRIKADEVHYWDTSDTKVGTMLKFVSAVTGKKLQEGNHGELHF